MDLLEIVFWFMVWAVLSCSASPVGSGKTEYRGISLNHWLTGPENYNYDVDLFVRSETQGHSEVVPTWPDTLVSALTSPFERDAMQVAMDIQDGSVGIVVVSWSAVWMAHIWGFPLLFNTGRQTRGQHISFEDAVLKPITKGSEHMVGLDLFSENPAGELSHFSAQTATRAFIVVPSSDSESYGNGIRWISKRLKNLIPSVRPQIKTYPRGSGNMEKILVQYSPTSQRVGVNARQINALRVWMTGRSNPIFQDFYAPLKRQEIHGTEKEQAQ